MRTAGGHNAAAEAAQDAISYRLMRVILYDIYSRPAFRDSCMPISHIIDYAQEMSVPDSANLRLHRLPVTAVLAMSMLAPFASIANANVICPPGTSLVGGECVSYCSPEVSYYDAELNECVAYNNPTHPPQPDPGQPCPPAWIETATGGCTPPCNEDSRWDAETESCVALDGPPLPPPGGNPEAPQQDGSPDDSATVPSDTPPPPSGNPDDSATVTYGDTSGDGNTNSASTCNPGCVGTQVCWQGACKDAGPPPGDNPDAPPPTTPPNDPANPPPPNNPPPNPDDPAAPEFSALAIPFMTVGGLFLARRARSKALAKKKSAPDGLRNK